MRVLDADALLSVAHHVDGQPALATADPVGLRLPVTRRRITATTRCGLDVGPTWVAAEPYEVPDCGLCQPATVDYQQDGLL